ncbi:MAG: hypothetical protein IT176_05240 [Acidobacteria bacterium]|nr:hypothetical protein [Acidobacteriota bacterium]
MRLDDLVEALHRFYGPLTPPPRDPFTLFVWEVLSAHSTPRRRDAALASLRRIPALTPDSLSRAPQKKLEDSARLAGAYTEPRIDALRAGAALFRRSPRLADLIRGPLAAARRALKPLPQLGEIGAHRMLLFAADHALLPIDAPVLRVGRRLGYGRDAAGSLRKQARAVRADVAGQLPASADAFRRAYLYLAHHGAATCTERDPHCHVCPLLADCPDGKARMDRAN